ncbi:MAG: hypothetical protein HKN43_16865 [Rhodothermales bacterium]|nr:hypothetical protein [Rhodothermales bacterium]
MGSDSCFLILGGSGLVGSQIVRQICDQLNPSKIVVAGLFEHEVTAFLGDARREFPDVEFFGAWGNIFVRDAFRHESRTSLLDNKSRRQGLYDDLFGDIEDAYERSTLAQIVREHRPDVMVDCINTATGLSYQDTEKTSLKTQDILDRLRQKLDDSNIDDSVYETIDELDKQVGTLLISQSTLQLIRHVRLLHSALTDVGTRLYVKVGTTGTGGMGLNIPYTHSEDRPSVQLMAKTSMAFAHTGLLFLMARTPNGPLVKEVKPAAMIGYRRVNHQSVRRQGNPQFLFRPTREVLGERLQVRDDEASYEKLGDLEMAGVDTGENGFFARGEFETITYLDQMEFVTPEEIAHQIVLEIKGSNTGIDVIAGVDSNVISPSYRAGVLRHTALEKLHRIEDETGVASVAVGHLGPPELSKILYEAHLLWLGYKTLESVTEADENEMGTRLLGIIQDDDHLRSMIVSIGVPILAPDGKTLFRGPKINIPESIYDDAVVTPDELDQWAAKGWIDLRAGNMREWKDRFERMRAAQHRLQTEGTTSISRSTYLSDVIEIGAVAAWIFNNEDGGYRIK